MSPPPDGRPPGAPWGFHVWRGQAFCPAPRTAPGLGWPALSGYSGNSLGGESAFRAFYLLSAQRGRQGGSFSIPPACRKTLPCPVPPKPAVVLKLLTPFQNPPAPAPWAHDQGRGARPLVCRSPPHGRFVFRCQPYTCSCLVRVLSLALLVTIVHPGL